ncbi:hypothetical protein BOW53_12225 [Solemya pervernicosa gill symbiont]|uniref:Aminoacetone oxidase family FAD-binding enzyme n=2 Tax=Gammaproteobacteria incertae sedis TaxID=118884 RepID=A0A1T2L2L7_9GAMM|nr:hypothetical protein BOW53_12225 [Solemya pervernicosa gill symbiont]QKQ28136.1 NAD(P)/FAD-dependent oxidoreductase [Candidatus Reidiella endopervernicosa]
MCAIEAGKRGRSVVVLDHSAKPGNKIRMAGGGRCNFTNYDVSADNYLSHNPHFCKSALSRYTQWDFIDLVQRYEIPYHERSHGQLFCNESARDILEMLLAECDKASVDVRLKCTVDNITSRAEGGFALQTSSGAMQCQSLVIATGGLSIPTSGATPFGYKVAEQFGLKVWPTRAGLVPFTLQPADKAELSTLSGIAVDSVVSCHNQSFREQLLFTHRGLSGPVILQISSFWSAGNEIEIDLLPDTDLAASLEGALVEHPQQQLKTYLSTHLPKRLVAIRLGEALAECPLKSLTTAQIEETIRRFKQWVIKPNGTEGYRTAEVTLGGVDCDALSSKTMVARKVEGLYFIGEVVDVTGWLGGYNLQWAWSSGWCTGQYV